MHSIADLHVAVAEWATAFDPDACSVEQCRSVLAEVVGVERIVAAVKAQVAARLASTGNWRGAGERSPAHLLARQTGTTVGAAREVLETGAALKELPDLAAAAKRGELAPG